MYHNGQIVHDIDKNKPCTVGTRLSATQFAWTDIPVRTTHYIESNPEYGKQSLNPISVMINSQHYLPFDRKIEQEYRIFLPKSLKQAKDLLKKGLIFPAPVPHSHHWKCGNWKSNCKCVEN